VAQCVIKSRFPLQFLFIPSILFESATGGFEMSSTLSLQNRERNAIPRLRALANQAFSRAAGAPLIEGNRIRLLIDARENYPAWLDAIRAAKRHVYFENYIIHEDEAG
jgi:cardiolipin synthase